MINHKSGKLNKGADDLSKGYLLLSALDSEILGCDLIKEQYKSYEEF